jgi:hypothetical protein
VGLRRFLAQPQIDFCLLCLILAFFKLGALHVIPKKSSQPCGHVLQIAGRLLER